MKRILRGQSWAVVFFLVAAAVIIAGSTMHAEAADPGICCYSDGECGDVSSPACGEGGIFVRLVSCDEVPEGFCDRGACCMEFTDGNDQPGSEATQADDISICRDDIIESQCEIGQWNPLLTCEENTCDTTLGACIVDGKCENVSRIQCLGEWKEGRCPAEQVPTVTEWGLVLLSIMLIGSAALVIRRRKRSS